MENATGTVISKQLDVEQKPHTETIQASVPSSFEFMEKPNSDGILQKQSEDSTKAGAGSDPNSTLKSGTISHKAFSVQDKVLLWSKSSFLVILLHRSFKRKYLQLSLD